MKNTLLLSLAAAGFLAGCAAPLPNTYSGEAQRALQDTGAKIAKDFKDAFKMDIPASTSPTLGQRAVPDAGQPMKAAPASQPRATPSEPQANAAAAIQSGPSSTYDPNANPNVIVEAVIPGQSTQPSSLRYEPAK